MEPPAGLDGQSLQNYELDELLHGMPTFVITQTSFSDAVDIAPLREKQIEAAQQESGAGQGFYAGGPVALDVATCAGVLVSPCQAGCWRDDSFHSKRVDRLRFWCKKVRSLFRWKWKKKRMRRLQNKHRKVQQRI